MKLTKVKRTEMKSIDGSDNVRYSAVLNNKRLFQYETDGGIIPHMTKEEFKDLLLRHENTIKI